MKPPLTPPESDLRSFRGMVLDIRRLLDSDFFLLATPEEFRAGFLLWIRSIHQIPAGSLPNDERILAKLAEAHDRWPEVRAMAMHRWTLCDDGRWYHATVAEAVHEALAWKRRQVAERQLTRARMRRLRARRIGYRR